MKVIGYVVKSFDNWLGREFGVRVIAVVVAAVVVAAVVVAKAFEVRVVVVDCMVSCCQTFEIVLKVVVVETGLWAAAVAFAAALITFAVVAAVVEAN